MDVKDVLLLILDVSSTKHSGRTVIQKNAYFMSILLRLNMGFFPHYYGPYSREVAETLEALVDFNFVDDSVKYTNRGRVMHSFRINNDGKKLAQSIKENNKTDAERISQIVKICEKFGQNYDILSWAAKIHWILVEKKIPVSEEEITSLAQGHNWNLTRDEIESAKRLLQSLDIVETKKLTN